MAETPPSREAARAGIRRHFNIDTPAEPGAPAPGPEVQRENPFAGMFRGAMSGVTDYLGRGAGWLIGQKDRISRASASPAAEQQLEQSFLQRASHKKVFGISAADVFMSAWESKTEIGVGMAAGAVTKEAAKTAASFFLPGGIVVRAGAGALAGAASAAARETVSGVRGYNKFKADLDGRLRTNLQIQPQTGIEQLAPDVVRSLRSEYDDLKSQLENETDPKRKELVSDHLRYLGYYIKKQEWRSSNKASSAREVLNEFFAYGSTLTNREKSRLEREITGADRVLKRRLVRKAMRGAAFGAAGGILGGILVDWISSSLEAAPSPLPAAGPTETPTPKPPTVTPSPEPTATATIEPPKPSPTAVPAEATPTAPRGPAIAPDAQAPAPPEPPQPPAAAPQPASPDASLGGPAPVPAESLPPTTAPTGAEVQGSTVDNSLTYDGRPWVIVDNGVKNIGNLFKTVGESGDIDRDALALNLQKATTLWAQGNLNPGSDPDLYKIFHLSNGTSSLYNNLLQNDTLESLKKLGIVIRK